MPDIGSESGGKTLAAGNAYAITPSDSADLSVLTRGLYVGTAGNVAVILALDSVAVTFVGVPAGSLLPIRVKRLMATNTTATNLVAVH